MLVLILVIVPFLALGVVWVVVTVARRFLPEPDVERVSEDINAAEPQKARTIAEIARRSQTPVPTGSQETVRPEGTQNLPEPLFGDLWIRRN